MLSAVLGTDTLQVHFGEVGRGRGEKQTIKQILTNNQ